MKIGIIVTGAIVGAIVKETVKTGHDVKVAKFR